MRTLTLILLAFPALLLAQLQDSCQTIGHSGGALSGGSFSAVQIIGQPHQSVANLNASTGHVPGWLGCVLLQPDRDTDLDGVPDELDRDNDNDQLDDDIELSGAAHTPNTPTDLNTADSDGDGADDGQEAAAGTNPNNPNSLLRITQLDTASETLSWQARAGKQYEVFLIGDLQSNTNRISLGTKTASGGISPWFAVITNLSVTNQQANAASGQFFAVEVVEE